LCGGKKGQSRKIRNHWVVERGQGMEVDLSWGWVLFLSWILPTRFVKGREVEQISGGV